MQIGTQKKRLRKRNLKQINELASEICDRRFLQPLQLKMNYLMKKA